MVDFAHHVPGRLRIQASRLKRNAADIAILRADLLNIDGVTSVSANEAIGSLTIIYDSRSLEPIAIWKGTRGKTPGKEEDRQMPCDYGALLKSNFVFCNIYLMEQITSVLHYSPIQNCCQR